MIYIYAHINVMIINKTSVMINAVNVIITKQHKCHKVTAMMLLMLMMLIKLVDTQQYLYRENCTLIGMRYITNNQNKFSWNIITHNITF